MKNKMHADEFEINEELVHHLLQSQCPNFSHLKLEPMLSSGTDHALFRLGEDYIVRLPRIAGAIQNINKEFEWVPKIVRKLSLQISEPVFKGEPHKLYPSPWLICKWNEGFNPPFERDKEYERLAEDLACFLNELHRIELANGPLSRRGCPLERLDEETSKALARLEGEIDVKSAASLWNRLKKVPLWNKDPVWVHGDLLPGNVLVNQNRLSAVIDFSDVGIGDPACDLVIAWSLFGPHSRNIFRKNLEHVDDDTWERGRGWALSIGLIILPYYKHTNPALMSVGRKMIENVHQGS